MSMWLTTGKTRRNASISACTSRNCSACLPAITNPAPPSPPSAALTSGRRIVSDEPCCTSRSRSPAIITRRASAWHSLRFRRAVRTACRVAETRPAASTPTSCATVEAGARAPHSAIDDLASPAIDSAK
nr:unnamed protein product [Digitaria exilis]